jgi:adenylate cyclase
LLLVQDALVQIRAMAYLRREVAAREDELPLDYHERIRLIADACENLPGYLRADTPVQGLKHAWKQANDMQQAWLRETLLQHGVAITDLVGN